MSHPYHGSSCSSYTYPAKCRDCGAAVFIYGCSCGSWVMFNELGAPWPQHLCFDEQYRALRKRVLPILQDGASPKSGTFQAFQVLKDYFEPAAARGFAESGPSQPDFGDAPAKPAKSPDLPAIKPMDPMEGDEQSFIGVIRERETGTARVAQLYDVLGTVGVKMLGLPPRSKAVQLTIVDTGGQPQESFTCIVDRSTLGSSLDVGVMVFATLVAKSAPTAPFWLATSVEAL